MRRLVEGKREQYPLYSPDGKTVFYVDNTTAAYVKVPIDGGKPERFSKEYAETNSGFDIARVERKQMNRGRVSLLSFVLGILVSLVVPVLIFASGAINLGADVNPGFIERTLAPWVLDRSVEKHAPNEKDRYTGDPAAIATGLDHYRENCVMCHGAPGVAGGELSKGLNPHAPLLVKENDMSDGELFWIIKHGIRMTPMPAFGPTHTDEEIWKIVALVRHLPNLSQQERDSLHEAASEEAHHH